MKPELFQIHADIEDSHWWFVARRRIMRRLVHRLAPPGSGATVVDVGCGTGGNLGALAGEYACVGIDSSAEAIAFARRRFPAVRFIEGVAPDGLGEVSAEASIFLIMDVLEHVPDDFAVLSGILRAGRPGAHVLITVPADLALWSEHDVTHAHFRRYDPARLAQIWQGLPVSVLLLSHFNARTYPMVKAVRTVSRLRGRASGQAGSDLRLPPAPVNAALTRLFEGEGGVLDDVVTGRRHDGYAKGVSLIAVLRREPGEVPLRARPAGVYTDPYARAVGSGPSPRDPR